VTSNSRESTGVTNNTNDGCGLFKCSSESDSGPACTISRPSNQAAKWNTAIIVSLSTPVPFTAVTSQNAFC